MGIAYLDIEDEITTAVGRLRASDDVRVALVLPPGSRIATSRINFRLLAREARERSRLLAIVTPEASVRAVAVSAGLPAYAAVSDYEAALAQGSVESPAETTAPPGGGRPPTGSPPTSAMAEALAAGDVEAALERTRVMPASQQPAGGEGISVPPTVGGGARSRIVDRLNLPDLPVRGGVVRERGSGIGRWGPILGVLVVLLALVGFGAYIVLPSATITITPQSQVLGPVTLTVVADPAATAVDPTTLVVPAQTVTFPLSANDSFPTTGTKVSETKATGTVTFQNYDTGRSVSIPGGVVVNTSAGVGFATDARLTIPRAQIIGRKTIVPGQANVQITATKAGTAGNVPANAITVVPQGYDPTLIAVFNSQATSGGTHTETAIVAQADYDNAVTALTARLETQMRNDLADPSQVPAGLTLFPATAQMGTVSADTAAKDVVGTAAANLTLTLSATATATAVDQSQLAPLAETRLKSQVPSGYQLFSGSITTTVGDGTVEGTRVSFPVQARAAIWKPVDTAGLLAEVKGKTVAQARQLLAPLGSVSISLWPSWVDTIPTLDQRLSLTVGQPVKPTSSSSASPVSTSSPTPSSFATATPSSSP
jgi:Baseplate J-like protein